MNNVQWVVLMSVELRNFWIKGFVLSGAYMDATGGWPEEGNGILLFTRTKKSLLILESVFFCSVFRIYKLVKQGKWLFSNSNSQVFLQYFLHTRRVREELVLRIQNGALTTQHDTEKRQYNTIQYNTLLTTPHGGFSVTMLLREVTIVSKKTKINSKTRYYVCMKIK